MTYSVKEIFYTLQGEGTHAGRPAGSAEDDQRRILTPSQALQAGSDYLVIGRPISQAANPQQALAAVLAELA